MVSNKLSSLPLNKQPVGLSRGLKDPNLGQGNIPSEDIQHAIRSLSKKIDAIEKLFTEAAKEMKTQEEEPIGDKLDKILEQNKTIAEGVVEMYNMLEGFIGGQRDSPDIPSFQNPDISQTQNFSGVQRGLPQSSPVFPNPDMYPNPRFAPEFNKPMNMQPQNFGQAVNNPNQPIPQQSQRDPNFEQNFNEQEFPEPPKFDQEGPTLMPAFSLNDVDKPKKKGLFGRFMQ
jgi:hypothetical protein